MMVFSLNVNREPKPALPALRVTMDKSPLSLWFPVANNPHLGRLLWDGVPALGFCWVIVVSLCHMLALPNSMGMIKPLRKSGVTLLPILVSSSSGSSSSPYAKCIPSTYKSIIMFKGIHDNYLGVLSHHHFPKLSPHLHLFD
jgi:hypothetical protein